MNLLRQKVFFSLLILHFHKGCATLLKRVQVSERSFLWEI